MCLLIDMHLFTIKHEGSKSLCSRFSGFFCKRICFKIKNRNWFVTIAHISSNQIKEKRKKRDDI